MSITRFLRGLTTNLGVKLIALVVAMVIWFNAIGQREIDRTYVASLEFVNVPDSLTVTGRVPNEVELSITGTRRELLLMGFKKIVVQVNMKGAAPGRFSQRLSVSDVLLPTGIEPRKVRILSPVLVDVTLQRLVTKRVRVAVSLAGSLQGDQLLSSVPEASPGWVMVTGPASATDSMEKIFTKPIDLSKIKESTQREVELEFDHKVFTCTPEKVTVTIPVSVRGKRSLANIPPTILVDEQDLVAEVYPKTVSLTLEGPKALLDTLSSGDVSVLVDWSGKQPGRYTLAPEVIVPDGVEKYVMNVDSLRILLSQTAQPRSK
ncbi:MAG: CdaR family protein [bacterium]